jgi:hypothetical protein
MRSIQPSLRDLFNAEFFPALKRRAISRCPSGTKRRALYFKAGGGYKQVHIDDVGKEAKEVAT